MRGGRGRVVTFGFRTVMVVGFALIAYASLEYFDSENIPSFVLEKLPVRFEALWLRALSIHVATALVTFPLCLLLTTRFLQRRRVLHRYLGRITALGVGGALVPSGAVLAFEAKGGALGTLGFLLSGAIVFVALVLGVFAARRGDQARHSYFMHHVVGQMSVAVTSRGMLVAFDVAGMNPDTAYLVALWAPVLGSAAFVEFFSGRPIGAPSPTIRTLSRSLS